MTYLAWLAIIVLAGVVTAVVVDIGHLRRELRDEVARRVRNEPPPEWPYD